MTCSLDANEGLDEGGTGLVAEQAAGLDQAGSGNGQGRPDVADGKEDQTEVMPSASPTASTSCEGRKSSPAQSWVRSVSIQLPIAISARPNGKQQARVEVAQQPGEQRHEQELRQARSS